MRPELAEELEMLDKSLNIQRRESPRDPNVLEDGFPLLADGLRLGLGSVRCAVRQPHQLAGTEIDVAIDGCAGELRQYVVVNRLRRDRHQMTGADALVVTEIQDALLD